MVQAEGLAPPYQMKTYEVRFVYYQYNQGDGRNGNYPYSLSFPTLEMAQTFAKGVGENLNSSLWMHERLHIDGYPVRLDGIWKITEEKVS